MTQLSTSAVPAHSHQRAWRVTGAALLVVLAVWLFVARAFPRMPDFEVYWRAGARAAAAEPLYRTSDGDYQFKYFPAFAVLAIPLGATPLHIAKAVWFVLSVAALLTLLLLTAASVPTRSKPSWLLIAVLLIAFGKYYAEDLVLGQINILVTCVATAAIVAFRVGREAVAGALVALAIVLKPYVLILVPWIAARRRPRAAVALTAGLTVAGALPVLVYGFDGTIALHRDWWRTVAATTEGVLLHSDNVSLASLWAKRLGIGTSATALAAVSSVALVLTTGFVFSRRRAVTDADGLEAGLLLAITPLISPQGWDYTLILATAAMAYVINGFDQLPRILRVLMVIAVAAIGLTLYDLLGKRLLYFLLDWSVITFGMLLLVAALVTLRVRKAA